MTTIPLALDRAAESRRNRGVVLVEADREERFAYSELREVALRCADSMADSGIEPGDRLLLLLPTGREFLGAFFGAVLLGAVPCPAAPPGGVGSRGRSQGIRLQQLIEAVEARAIVASSDRATDYADIGHCPVLRGDEVLLGPVAGGLSPQAARDPAFVQFTSGTTAGPRGVTLGHGALTANVLQIAEAAHIDEDSTIVSWLPLHHDMGLIGGVLTALLRDVDLVLTTPIRFLRQPRTWLEDLSRSRATHSPAPAFAYRYLLDRLGDADLEGIDLRNWRVAFVGAEPIPPAVLTAFTERLAPCGFRPEALLPCYGLAEATLAVTFDDWRKPWRSLAISRRALASTGTIEPPSSSDDEIQCVSCGRPLRGDVLRILDGEDRELPERQVGEIVVWGPSLFSGYWGEAPREIDQPLRTGDLGFIDQGDLFVTGRQKDLIILRGENHHPSEIEWVLADCPGLRTGRIVALGLPDASLGTESLHLVAEVDRRSPVERGVLVTTIRRKVHEATGLTVAEIHLVGAGIMPVTTSGKIQRSKIRERLLAGETL